MGEKRVINNSYKWQIVKWSCIGLTIRLILMPFTMHGQDLFFLNYFPMMFVRAGIWDPYVFIATHYSYFPATYYGPVLFFIMAIPNFIFVNLFHASSLVKILETSSTMMGGSLNTIDYINAFSKLGLFKNLFLMKVPYLIFDFLIGVLLLRLAISKKSAMTVYAFWMLNIVVLQSVYAVGGAYLIPTLFIVLSYYFAVNKRPYLSIISLSLGGATMLLPYILILPACLLLGKNWKERFLFIFTAVLCAIVVYLPFYLHSGNQVFRFLVLFERVQYGGLLRLILRSIFIVLYGLVSIAAIKDSQRKNPERQILYYFVILMFLNYAIFPVRFRYFVFITPFLMLLMPGRKKFSLFMFFIVFLLAFLWLPERDLQLGSFAPLNPEYFLSIPTFQEMINRFVNIEIVYKIMARVLLLTFFVAAWWIWRIKLNNERELLRFGEGL